MPRAVGGLSSPSNYPDIDFDKVTGTLGTISDLKAQETNGINDDDIIHVKDYYSDVEGGGGFFYWDSTSTESDNGGTIIKPTFSDFSGTGRWKREISSFEYVNIKWFGCKTDGSDITDDYEAARTYAESERLFLFAPDGEYSFDGLISVTTDTGLIGASSSARNSDVGRGTVFKKISSSGTFRIDHSTFCSNFCVDANDIGDGINTFNGSSGTTGLKYSTLKNIWVLNYVDKGINCDGHFFNLTLENIKLRASSSATDPTGIYLAKEDQNGNIVTSESSPSCVIINPSIYGTSEADPKGTGIKAYGANSLHIISGECVQHEKWFDFDNCEVVWDAPDLEYAAASSLLDDTQMKMSNGIIHTYRGDAAGWTKDDIPFSSSNRMFFVCRSTNKKCTLTIDGVEFRNYLGTDAGSADNDFSIVGLEQNLNGTDSSVTIKNERYETGTFGEKVLMEQERTYLVPIAQVGRNRYKSIFSHDFDGSETGDVVLKHIGGGDYDRILSESIARSVYWQVTGSSLTNDTELKVRIYDETGASLSTTTVTTISSGDDEGNTKSNEIVINNLGRLTILANSSSFPSGCNLTAYVQVEER